MLVKMVIFNSDAAYSVSGKHDIEMNVKSGKQIMESEEGLQVAYAEAEKVKKRIYEAVQTLAKKRRTIK